MRKNIRKNIFFFCLFFLVKNSFFSSYHSKMHRVTKYIAVKNKINKARQYRTNKRKQNKIKKKNKKKKENEMKLHATRHTILFVLNRVSKYQSVILLIGCHFFNNLSLLELVNSFSISLIFLIVIFRLSKLSCLVFLAL